MTRREGTAPSRSRKRFVATLIVAGLVMGGCTDFAGYDLDYIIGRARVLSTMRNTISLEPQDLALLPPVGTVPVAGPGSSAPPPFSSLQLDSVAPTLSNPLPVSEAVRARGEVVYNNNCAVCHGTQGAGDGSIIGAGRFPMAPSLVSGTAPGRSDGYLYAIIRAGRGLMPSYGDRIDHEDRWAVVHYVRSLQGETIGAPSGAIAAAVTPDTGTPADAAQQPAAAPQ